MSTNLEIATLISAVLVFVSSCATLIITTVHNRKDRFINTITEARKDYIRELRDLIAEFCSLAYSMGSQDKSELNQDKIKLLRSKSIKIKLFMNPARYPKCWDGKAIELIDDIIQEPGQKKVDDLIVLMQSWLALEWKGLMTEGKKGNLTEIEKDELRMRFWEDYERYITKEYE
ncbi:MAG: hypothetical protein LBK07_03020 [Tannerella sp.]|jgi:hypothetical protein|nr:hypothetical protein [Tannerella sp.]